MTPRPRPSLDARTFAKLRRIAPNLLDAHRSSEPHMDWHARPLPEEVAFKLTNRCDLRCAHCYQWNDQGYHHGLRDGDLDLRIVAKVLRETEPVKSNVYLWGGEPLAYRSWDGLVDLLAADRRWTSMCTNGTMLERRLPGILRLSEHLEVVVSIDGFEAEHDALRGTGAFAKAMTGVRALVSAKQSGRFLGEITVNCVFNRAMVGHLHDFVVFLDEAGVDTVYLSFPWHLSDAASANMDAHVAAHFPWLNAASANGDASWHSYKFALDASVTPALVSDLEKIDGHDFRIKVRYNPKLTVDEIQEFLAGSDRPAQGKTRCMAHRTRMDVFPNGDVVSCKFFPEFAVGNLHQSSVAEAWLGEAFDRVRETVARCGLMPACAKCNLLYTRGV